MFANIDQGKEKSSLPKVHYIQDCFYCHSCKEWAKSTHAVPTEAFLQMITYCFTVHMNPPTTPCHQWWRKIVEFRGAEARRHAALPCFSPANIEPFIATNSPDDSLLLSSLHSESLPSDSDKLSTSTLPSILRKQIYSKSWPYMAGVIHKTMSIFMKSFFFSAYNDNPSP